MDINLIDKNLFFISAKALQMIALKARKIIQDRTAEGKDVDDTPFKPYSEKWFARPYAGHNKREKAALETLYKQDDARYIRRDDSILYILVKGYRKYKEAVYPREFQGGTPNLRATGEMMDALTVIETNPNQGSFKLGWLRPELAERAFYVSQLREFLGLNDDETRELAEYAKNFIEMRQTSLF